MYHIFIWELDQQGGYILHLVCIQPSPKIDHSVIKVAAEIFLFLLHPLLH